MPFVQRYSDVKKGGIVFTGNTLGLSKASNQNALALLIDSKGANPVITKSADKTFAVAGDTLHYTSVITNTGSLLKSDLVFTDPIPAGTTFTAGSVKINGAAFPAYDPQAGFALPDLAVGEAVTVEFDVTVN